jgi:hypothetical protein
MVGKGSHCLIGKDGHNGDKLRGFSFLLSLEVLMGVGIIYSVTVNLLLVIYWVWLSWRGFYFKVLKGFPLCK